MRIAATTFVFAALMFTTSGCADQQTQDTAADTMQTDTAMDTAAAASPQMAQQATVGVSQQEPYGEYLVDGENRSLYLFEGDEQSSGQSTCYDACAGAWPPLLTDGTPMAGAAAVDSAMLGTIDRRDGSQQVTYNGWPLYHFSKDQRSGDVMGQDVEGFGAEWYLVSPQGTEVEEE